MSYFVVKKSGNQNKSIELKTSEPPKPYMAVKRSGTVGYIPLTTETSGTGVKIKKNNKNYKVVETYTTSIDSSSTYNSYYNTTSTSYYTQTTSTAYVPCDNFSIVNRHQFVNSNKRSASLSLSITTAKAHILRIYSNGNTTSRITASIYGEVANSTMTKLINISDTVNNISVVNILLRYTTKTTLYYSSSKYRYLVTAKTFSKYKDRYSYSSTYYGQIETASFLTAQYTRPSAQYQTYSKATSYYTVSTTSQ